MKAIKLDNPSRSLGAPPNWNAERDGVCNTLDIWDRDGAMISGWRPSPAELAKLNAGDPLFLHIFNNSHPVVAMSVGYDVSPCVQELNLFERFLRWCDGLRA